MADEDQGSDELAQGRYERVDAGDVEVGRGLVHQQQVRRIEEQLHQCQASLFTTAEHRHFLEDVIIPEEEASQQGSDVQLGHPGRRVGSLLQHRPLGLQHFGAVLGEVTHLHPQPQVTHTGLRRQVARQQLEQGGLAGAVGSDQHRAVAPLRFELEAGVNHVLPVGEIHPFESDDPLTALLRLRECKINRRRRLLRRVDLLHAVDLLELGLSPRRRGVLGSEPVHEVHQATNFALLVLEGGQLLLLLGLALVEKGVVVARVAVEPLIANLDDTGDQLIEKLPVVRDDQNRSRVILQIALKPNEGFEIQMVGGLIEHEDVRLMHQQPGQVRPHDPTTGQLARRPLKIRIAEGQALEQALGLGDGRTVGIEVVIIFRLGTGSMLAGGDFQHRLITHRRALLGQEADGRPALEGHQTVVRLLLLEDELEERGLAGAIRTHQAQSVLTVELQRQVREQGPSAIALGHIGNSQHCCELP